MTRLLMVIAGGVFGTAGLLIVAGVLLVYLGATGVSEVRFLGQELRTPIGGLVSLMLGCTLVLFVIPKVLNTIVHLQSQPGDPNTDTDEESQD